MKKVEQLVEEIRRSDEIEATVGTVADSIIAHFREELGLYGGRIYRRLGEDYILRSTFGDVKRIEPGFRISRRYPAIDACLDGGTVFMDPAEPGLDRALEEDLGVREFACVEVGNEEYILAFNVAPGQDRESILLSLGILRHSINQLLRQERLAEVIREARKIQVSILPRRTPEYGSFEIAGRTVPMETMGGDFYDFIPITEKILGLAIADVSGHGLPAALQTRDIHMGLRMGMAQDIKIVRTVERLNRIIHKSTLTSRFVALFYGELEENGNFLFVNAGHVPPCLLREDGGRILLTEGGAVLGPLEDAAYERGFVRLRPGDLLVMFTDGMIEATCGDEEYGLERLLKEAESRRHRPAEEIVSGLFESLESFCHNAPPEDDRTVVVVRFPPVAG